LCTVFTRGLYEQIPEIRDKIVGYAYAGYAIGNSDFQKDFDEKIPNFFRMVNDQDIVPHYIPPWLGYDHVGVLVHMTQTGMTFDKVRRSEERSDEPTTPLQAAKITRTRTSVQDTPS
jgi:hypothetical protein